MTRLKSLAALLAALGALWLPRGAAAQEWYDPSMYVYSGVELTTTPYMSTNGSYTIGWGYQAGTSFPVFEYLMESVNGGTATQVPITGASKAFSGRQPGYYTYQLWGVDFIRGWMVKSFPASVMVLPPGSAITVDGYDFGVLTVNTQRTGTVRVRNIGSANLTVSGCSTGMDNEHAENFFGCSFTRPLPITIPPGSSEPITVSVAPTWLGGIAGAVFIDSDAAGGDGQGSMWVHSVDDEANAPQITIDPLELDFGAVPIGTTATRTVYVRNDGTGDLQISAGCRIETYAENTNTQNTYRCSFSRPSPWFSIPPGTSEPLTVTFTPQNTYGAPGVVMLMNNAYEYPHSWLKLHGRGVQ